MRIVHGIMGAALAAIVLLGACSEKGPEEKKAADTTVRRDSLPVPADTTLQGDLPAGRFHLPTRHTPVPDFFITLPEGYTVRNMSRLPNDEYFVLEGDDPSLKDSTAITPGFLVMYVGVKPQEASPESGRAKTRNVMLGSTMVTMKMWADTLPDGRLYYIRDIASSDYFASLSPELAKAPLHLHVYVAGLDPVRVNALVQSVESLSFSP